MNATRISLPIALLAATTLGATTPALGQTYHMPATPERGFWMEASYADLKGIDQAFPSTSWFLSGRIPVTPSIRMTADVPFAYSRLDIEGGDTESSAVLGNPYIGAEYAVRGFVIETGVRLPINSIDAESTADVIGLLGDFQRGEAFTDQVVPVSGAVSYEQPLFGETTIRGRVGVVGLFSTLDDQEESHDEALLDYGVLGTYPVGPARLGLGVYGRWVATEDEGDFSDNSVHHLALSGDLDVRGVRPGVAVRIPMDPQYDDILGSTVSLYLQVPLR